MRYRKTYAEVNLDNLYDNYLEVLKRVNYKTVIPVVKANAYGHGAVEVVRHLRSKNVLFYAVSLLEEADQLRSEFQDIEILIMGVTSNEYFNHCATNNYTVTISNMDQIDGLMKLNKNLKVHLKVDSGMNRLGFKSLKEIKDAVSFLKSHQMIDLEGIYTHFATADCDYQYYQKQTDNFESILHHLDYDFKMIHSSNSSSSIKYEKDIKYTTHTRLGISLYGLTLDKDTDFLKNTYKLVTQISEFKHLKKGEKVGYGITYEAKEKELIGILPIGYADGFIRGNRDGDVEINGKRYPIIGTICMDQMFIKVDSTVTKQDQVVLFGGLISIDEVAKRLNTINYEIICQITYRVPKIYLRKE